MKLRFFSAVVVAATSLLMTDTSAVQLEACDSRQLEYGKIMTLAQELHADGKKETKVAANEPAAKAKHAPLAQKPKKVVTEEAVEAVKVARMLVKNPPNASAAAKPLIQGPVRLQKILDQAKKAHASRAALDKLAAPAAPVAPIVPKGVTTAIAAPSNPMPPMKALSQVDSAFATPYGMYAGAFEVQDPATMLAASYAQPMLETATEPMAWSVADIANQEITYSADQGIKSKQEFDDNVRFMAKHLENQPPEPGCIGPPATTPKEQKRQNDQLQDVLQRVLQQDLAKRVGEIKQKEEEDSKCAENDEAKEKCMERHAKLREELSKRDAQMDHLRNMINTTLLKKEDETKQEIEKSETKLVAQQAVKKALDKQRKVELRDVQQEKQKENFGEYLHKKREKQDWKAIQGALLNTLEDRLQQWRYTGTQEARQELFDLLSASSAALKAQYFKTTEGQSPEINAMRAAKVAVAQLGHASQAAKQAQGKKAAEMYMQQDGERKKEMILLDESIKMLGPVGKAKGSPVLNQNVDAVHDLLSKEAECKQNANGVKAGIEGAQSTFDRFVDGEVLRLDGENQLMGKGVNPFVLKTPAKAREQAVIVKKETPKAEEKKKEEPKVVVTKPTYTFELNEK